MLAEKSVVKSPITAWLGVISLALGAAAIVTTEFIPIGFIPNVAAEMHVSLGMAGVMILVPGLSAAIAAPLVIVGAGRLDRRKLIFTLGSLLFLSNALAAIAPSFALVLVARVFLGVAIGGFWAVVPALGARLVGAAAGTRATSIIVSGLSAGTVIGLPAGRFFGELVGWRMIFAGAAVISLLVIAIQIAVLPSMPATGKMTFTVLGGVLRQPVSRLILIAAALATAGQFAASTFATPFFLQQANLSSDFASLLFLGYGAAGVAGTLLGSPLVTRGRSWTFVGAVVSFGVILILLPLIAGAPVVVSVLYLLWGIIWGLVPLSLQTLILAATPQAPEAGSAMFMSVAQLAIAAGSGLGGYLVDTSGLPTVFIIGGTIALAAGTIGVLLAHVSRTDHNFT